MGVAVGVVGLVRRLPRDVAGRHIGGQLVRAVTSGGANYEEARRAESRRDFVHKLGIASKELAEALYWLQLISRLHPQECNTKLLAETHELLAILVSSARTARHS